MAAAGKEAAATSNGKSSPDIEYYESHENLKKLCNFLMSRQGPAVREALLMDRRVHYIKGMIIEELLSIMDVTALFWRHRHVILTLFFSSYTIIVVPSLWHIILGEKLVNFLVEPKKGTKWPSKLPRLNSRQDAIAVCKNLIKEQFLVRTDKQGKGELSVSTNIISIYIHACVSDCSIFF